MSYARRISFADSVDPGFPHYQVVMAAGGESATVVGCFLDDGGHPPLHTHDVDLFYAVLSGSATVQLGRDRHQAQAGEVIFVPAGLPHGSDNRTGAAERHVEFLVPGIQPGAPVLRPVKSLDDAPMPAASAVVKAASGPPHETSDGKRRWILADESTAEHSARITGVEADGRQAPGAVSSLESERILLVTEGRLDAEIAGREQVVPAEAVIVIPAGVPHALWNSTPDPVRYLDLVVTAPAAYDRLAS